MRFFIFAVMIALLPLRGFAGDVMATEMAIQMAARHVLKDAGYDHHVNTATQATAHADHLAAPAPLELAGCTAHAAAEQCHSSDNHGSCQACQACHTVALSAAVAQVETVLASSRLPQPAAAQFASAEAALGQKPPIF